MTRPSTQTFQRRDLHSHFFFSIQIDWHVLESRLKKIEGVQDVHDLHVWSISSATCAMTVHIRVREIRES